MKPKFRRTIRKAFPSLIVIPAMAAMLPSLSQATVFPTTDPFGNVTLNDATRNGANTFIASGGSSPTPTVIFSGIGIGINAVQISGDVGETDILRITSPGYTVTLNSDTRLTGTNHDGIFATSAFILNNAGRIAGGGIPGTRQGVDVSSAASSATVLNNLASGQITTTNTYAIWFRGAGGTVVNTGLIESFARGTNGASSVGIHAGGTLASGTDNNGTGDFLSVTNVGSANGSTGGIIRGLDHGIRADDDLFVDNGFGALIVGTNEHGIFADNRATIENYGTIRGGVNFPQDGIQVGEDATITNFTSFNVNSPFQAIGGGLIEGLGGSGIQLDSGGYVENQEFGIIRGATHGIFGANTANAVVGDDIEVQNHAGAQIIGLAEEGIRVDDRALINNLGIIRGATSGIRVDDDTNAANSGGIFNAAGAQIIGTLAGITADDDTEITNAGWIGQEFGSAAVLAIDLDGGTNTMNLNVGSVLWGDVNGGSGVDTINLGGGWDNYDDWTLSASADSFDDFAGGNLIFGDISSVGFVNKIGPGLAVIDGDSLRINTINVNGGELYINTSSATLAAIGGGTNTINVSAGAEVGGTGTWNSNINLLGLDSAISAGNNPAKFGSVGTFSSLGSYSSIGLLNIVGSVTHSSGSFIRHDIDPLSGADDLITHSVGTYAVGSDTTIRIAPTDNNYAIQDGVYTVIDSSNPISYGWWPDVEVEFNEVINQEDGGFQGTQTYLTEMEGTGAVINQFMWSDFTDGGTNLVVYVEHDYEGIGEDLGSNEAALGAALDESVSYQWNDEIQDFIAALDYSDIDTVNATLTSLVPDGVFGLTAGVLNSNYRLHRLAQNHLAATRSGTIIEMTADTVDAKGHTVPGTTSSSASGNGNVWGTLSYDWQDSDYVDGEVTAFTVGADYRVAPNFLVGLMLDGSEADNDFRGGSSDVDSLRAAIYATYGASTGIYADFLVGYGDHDLDLDRTFAGVPGLGGTSGNSNTDATSLQAMAIVGYAMESGTIKHGPFAGLEYQDIDVDSFTQTGPLPIGVSGYDVESLRGLIGYRVEATYGNFSPYASIAYAHEFEDGSQSTTATLPGGAQFRVDGGELDSALLLGVGTGYSFNANLGMNIGYRGEISTGDGMDSHGGSVGLNYSF